MSIIVAVEGSDGVGKAQPLDSVVMTPNGPVKMGDIKIGDIVCNPDGETSTVIGVYPQGKLDIYKIVFDDGEVLASADHLWYSRIANSVPKKYKKKKKVTELFCKLYRLRTTQQIKEHCDHYKDKKRKFPIVIPLTSPIKFTPKGNLPIEPYFLGLLLGDGTFRNSSIKVYNAEEQIGKFLIKECNAVKKQAINYIIKDKGKTKAALESLELYGCHSYEKFIPEAYKYSSTKDRLYLIQGLMDTDGTVGKQHHSVSYTSTSQQLALDMQWILQSLGFRAVIRDRITKFTYKEEKKEGRRSWTLHIQGPLIKRLFRLSSFRKDRLKNYTYNGGKSIPSRRVLSVEYIGKMECQCIKVDNPNSLYLTDFFLVTHNTTLVDTLETWLKGWEISVIRLKQPGYTQVGEMLRSILKDSDYAEELEASPMAERLMFAADFRLLVDNEIEACPNDEAVFLMDRHTFISDLAYSRIDLDFIKKLHALIDPLHRYYPTFCILLDAPVAVTRGRIGGGRDRIECVDGAMLEHRRQVYLEEVPKMCRDYKIIDATKSKEEVADEAIEVLAQFLELEC